MDRGDDQSAQTEQPQEGGSWQYKPASASATPPMQPAQTQPAAALAPATASAPTSAEPEIVEWTASEFVAHDKGPGWYALLILAALGVAGVIYIITQDAFSTVVVLILAVIMAVAASRKPRVLTYRLDKNGVTAGNKFHPYKDYKSFAYQEEGPFASIVFVPMNRFSFAFSVYLAPEDEDRVIKALSAHLPLERGQLDSVDRLMRRVRF
jgi:hypothetical protein